MVNDDTTCTSPKPVGDEFQIALISEQSLGGVVQVFL